MTILDDHFDRLVARAEGSRVWRDDDRKRWLAAAVTPEGVEIIDRLLAGRITRAEAITEFMERLDTPRKVAEQAVGARHVYGESDPVWTRRPND